MNRTMDMLSWFERWYASNCNGEWEQAKGVLIQTIDNPGWWVKIDLGPKELNRVSEGVLEVVGEPPSEKNANVAVGEWMLCKVTGGKFDGAGDPSKLGDILRCFRDQIAEPTNAEN